MLMKAAVEQYNQEHPEAKVKLEKMTDIDVHSCDPSGTCAKEKELNVQTTSTGTAALYVQYAMKFKTEAGTEITINVEQGWDTGIQYRNTRSLAAEEANTRIQAVFLSIKLKVKAVVQPNKDDPTSPRHYSDKKMEKLNITEFTWNRSATHAFGGEYFKGKTVAHLGLGSLHVQDRYALVAIRIGKATYNVGESPEFRMKIRCDTTKLENETLETSEAIVKQARKKLDKKEQARSKLEKLQERKAKEEEIKQATEELKKATEEWKEAKQRLSTTLGTNPDRLLNVLQDEVELAGDRLSELAAILPRRKGEKMISRDVDLLNAQSQIQKLKESQAQYTALEEEEAKLLEQLPEESHPTTLGTLDQRRAANYEWLRKHNALPQEGNLLRTPAEIATYLNGLARTFSESEKKELEVRLKLRTVYQEIGTPQAEIEGIPRYSTGLRETIMKARAKALDTADLLEKQYAQLTTHYQTLLEVRKRLKESGPLSPSQQRTLQELDTQIKKLETRRTEQQYESIGPRIRAFRTEVEETYKDLAEKAKVIRENTPPTNPPPSPQERTDTNPSPSSSKT